MEEGTDRTTVRARGQGGRVWNSFFHSWHSNSQQLWWPARSRQSTFPHGWVREGHPRSHNKLKSYWELMAAREGWDPCQGDHGGGWLYHHACLLWLESADYFFKKEYIKLGGGRGCVWKDLEVERCDGNKGYKYMIFSKNNKNVVLLRWEI